jgi:phosphate starvation-inducible PhoH-like protein
LSKDISDKNAPNKSQNKSLGKSLVMEFEHNDHLPTLYGQHNSHLHHIEKQLGVSIADRGNTLNITGDVEAIEAAEKILSGMWDSVCDDNDVGLADIDAALRFHHHAQDTAASRSGKPPMTDKPTSKPASKMTIQTKKKSIVPRSPRQEEYLKLMGKRDMTFGLGSAGTGKTYLAVAMGVSMYLQGNVDRLIFTRPAVEAGENLGFLPGDMKEKIDPYLQPIYDSMQDMIPWDEMVKKMESGDIEIAPLAFMRGRTLSNAFVILDEAQNTTTSQMKMFLTRMGEASHMVITGDITQTDLPRGVKSGLRDAVELLEGIPDIGFIRFDKNDVVRHPLVGKIVDAYDKRAQLRDLEER